MGYTPPTVIYNINYDDELLAGIQVKARGLTFGEWSNPELMSRVDRLGLFLAKVESWNLEDEDDNPIPPMIECEDADDERHGQMIPNQAGLSGYDPKVIWAIYQGWENTAANVEPSAPLEPKSNGGELSGAPQIPMEPLGDPVENSVEPSG